MAQLPIGFVFVGWIGNNLTLSTASWKGNVEGIYEPSTNRSAFVSFKPASTLPAIQTLVTGNIYLFRVKTVFSLADTDAVVIVAAGQTSTKLAVPTGLAATPTSSTTIGVSWNPVTNATGYRLQQGSTIIYTGPTTSYTDAGLQAGFTYSYSVQALYSGSGSYGNSLYSDVVQATTQAVSGAAPVITSLTPSSGKVGDSIQVNGSNLLGATVKFGTVTATVTGSYANRLAVTVPAGATTSLLTVTTTSGSASKQFTLTQVDGAPVPNILFTGNSLIAGSNGPSPVPTVKGLLPTNWGVNNEAIGGQGISSMISNIASQVDPHFNPAASVNILVYQEGTNEINGYDTKAAQYTSMLRARGWKVVFNTIPPRTTGNDGFLAAAVALNQNFRNTPSVYGDALVDLSLNNKVGRFGDVTNYLDPTHASNDPSNYTSVDHIHWLQPAATIVGYMVYDAINFLVNNIPQPDPRDYPPNQVLPGEQVIWAYKRNVVEQNGGLTPVDGNQGQFAAQGYSQQKILAGPGFCGAFQWEADRKGGFVGAQTPANIDAGPYNGYYNGTLVVHGPGMNDVGAAPGDVFRVEMYADTTVWLKNGNEVYRDNTPPPFPLVLQVLLDGAAYGGISHARVEGNIG